MVALGNSSTLECSYDNDGFIIGFFRKNSASFSQSTTLNTQCESHIRSCQNHLEPRSVFETDDEYPPFIPERPVSRQSHYKGESWRRVRRPCLPPPIRVRRYPFILSGHYGLYTISQICRHIDISPKRESAVQLRRFRLLNEMLDRSHAEGYTSCRPTYQPNYGGSGLGQKQHRPLRHGSSKLRNEISLSDLAADDASEYVDEFSFEPPSEHSFISDLTNGSLDFEMPMKTTSSAGDESDETSFESSGRNILGPEFASAPMSLSCASEELDRYRGGSHLKLYDVASMRGVRA